jgi:UDP-3-O-[3-hydroxymyristoyl] N-acetylglucosamine deacetylase
VGDFSLLGYPLLGHVKAYKAGHDINHQMVENILAKRDSWQLVEAGREVAPPARTRASGRAFSAAGFSKV